VLRLTLYKEGCWPKQNSALEKRKAAKGKAKIGKAGKRKDRRTKATKVEGRTPRGKSSPSTLTLFPKERGI
jgi:hypothetical protein